MMKESMEEAFAEMRALIALFEVVAAVEVDHTSSRASNLTRGAEGDLGPARKAG